MITGGYSLARKPSLSTIDSVETTAQYNTVPYSSRRKSNHNSPKQRCFPTHPYIPSPATINQAFPTTRMSLRPVQTEPVRIPSTQTKYMEMLLHLDRIPRVYNILAGAFTWILLASFLIVPGTFTSFKNSDLFKSVEGSADKSNAVAKVILSSAANVGLLWLSGIFCCIGGCGCLSLWFRWRCNYVWIVNKVFL